MANEQLILPTGEKADFVYLRKWPELGDMIYLQSMRSGRMKEDSLAARGYKGMARVHAGRLADLVRDKVPPFDAVVSPPSKRADADVYRNEIVKGIAVRDLTPGFSRKGKISAGTASSVAEVVDEFDYQPAGGESDIKSLLIVDESVSSGRTIAAVLDHLRRTGLSNDCIVCIAAAAWLVEKKPKPAPATQVGGSGCR